MRILSLLVLLAMTGCMKEKEFLTSPIELKNCQVISMEGHASLPTNKSIPYFISIGRNEMRFVRGIGETREEFVLSVVYQDEETLHAISKDKTFAAAQVDLAKGQGYLIRAMEPSSLSVEAFALTQVSR